ncbi:MAG: anti-sigma F factor [Acholeplasmatales bacterium]|nr:anti-sigma F factor [Acholeplasmatales bacterium]
MENEIRMTFLSKKCNISVIRNMLGAMIIDNNPTITFVNELKTIVSEAITNCIVHGYNNEEDKYIDMNIFVKKDCIIIDIIDKGVGIEDIELAKEALFSTKSNEERSGLGFTIMELFSDSLIVESKLNEGTYLHIEKKW